MTQDPIVAEIHQIREQLWRECHGSADQMAQRQRQVQEQNKDRIVNPEEWFRHRKPGRKRP